MQLSRLQRIYRSRILALCLVVWIFVESKQPVKSGQAYFFSCKSTDGGNQCLVSMDSDLEAFSRNPARGSVAALAFQLTAFTNYANRLFLSY